MNPGRLLKDFKSLMAMSEELLDGLIYLKPEEWDSPEQEEVFDKRVEEITTEIERLKSVYKIKAKNSQGN